MNQYGRQRQPFLFVIDFDIQKPLFFPLDKASEYLRFSFSNSKRTSTQEKLTLTPFPVSYENYLKAFNHVKKNILYGNTFLLNLTQATPVEISDTLENIYDVSSAKYKLLLNGHFVVFSPETFVQINGGGIISSYPMKGTIDASIPDAKKIILDDHKEQAEHATIVDLIRNDLSLVARDVKVERYRYTEKIKTNHKTLFQVSSKVTGKISKDWHRHLGTIFTSMLPAGSISGAPKKKTVEIIREAEGYERGYYTGIAGLYDGKKVDSFVMIRFIEKTKKGYLYKSGGGITSFSDPRKEYQELIDKIYVPIC